MFIVIDGPDGVGKSTQMKMLANHMREIYKNAVVELSEPTKESDAGIAIRESINEGRRFEPIIEATFFIEDRRYDIQKRILPALKKNKTVLLDRFYYSTIAYQSALGIPKEELYEMHAHFIIEPDLVFILHCPIDVASKRIEDRGKKDVMEQKEYQARVDEIFRGFVSDHIFHVDADKSIEEIHAEIAEITDTFIKNNKTKKIIKPRIIK